MICKTILNFCVVHISNDENLGEFLTHMQKSPTETTLTPTSHHPYIDILEPHKD